MRLEDLPAVNGVRHRTVRANGHDLHVAEAGDGPPLLLAHGWPQHWWAWRKVIPRLAQRYRVLALDLHGWGWSDAPAGDYDKPSFAADLLGLLEAEGIDRARIVSHDWGGYAAFLLALEHPERVERLVALDIAPPWNAGFHPGQLLLPVFASYQVLLSTPGVGRRSLTSGRLVPLIMRLGSGPGHEWTGEEVQAFTVPLREPARAQASVNCYRTFLTRELPAQARGGDRSGELRVPTLLVMGGASMLRRVANPRATETMRVEVIEGAGHFLAEEAPDDVLRLAEPFLG